MKLQNKAARISALAVIAVSIFCCQVYSGSVAEDALKKGLEYGRQGDNDNAIAEFSKVIALDPASAEAYYDRAFVYYKKGKLKESISDFDKTIALDPASADAYYNRGLAFYKMGSFDAAIADYNKVLEIKPDAMDALYGRGLAYFKKNDIKQALSDYSKVIEMRPEFSLAYSARAIAYFSKKDYGRSLADVNKAIALGFRLRPLKETSPEPLALAPGSAKGAATKSLTAPGPEKIEPSRLAGKAPGKSQTRKGRRRSTKIKIYALAVLLIICLTTILTLLIKIRKAKTVRPQRYNKRRSLK